MKRKITNFIHVSKTKTMKTRSTLNFLKRAGVLLMLLAIFVTSCNKYDDDFKDLNAKIDALAAQVQGVAALQTALAAAQAQLTTLSAAIAALPNPTASITTLGTNLTALTANVATIQTALNDLASDVADGNATAVDAAAVVAQLQLDLTAAQTDLTQVLANTSMYVGAVSITSDAEVDFWTPKIAQLAMINGSLTVTTAGISVSKIAAMNVILPNITAVIGNVTITAAASKAIDLSELTSIVGNFTATGGNLIPQSTLDISSLASVTGDLTLSFDGPYESTALTTVGGDLALTSRTTTGSTVTGTTLINFPNATVSGASVPVLSFPSATSIVLPGNLTSLTAILATSVKLTKTTFGAAISITPKSTATVDLSAITGAAGITVTTGTTVNLSNLVTSTGAISITTVATGTFDLSNFSNIVSGTAATQNITIIGAKTVTLPKYVLGTLTAADAETVNLGKFQWGSVPAFTATSVKYLTLGEVNAPVDLAPYTALITANIVGKTQTVYASCAATVTATSANAALTTVTVGGVLNAVSITGVTALTSVATSGVVNSFTITGCTNTALTTLGLAHIHFVGGPGSTLVITGNTKLASLTTSTNYMKTLTVTDNTVLASMNFSTYVDILYPGSSVGITISGNDINGSYTAPVTQTATSPFAEAIVKSNDLLTLKAYVAKMAVVAASITQTLSIDVDDIDAVTVGNQLLSTTMVDAAIAVTRPTVVDATGGINTADEMALVVAQ